MCVYASKWETPLKKKDHVEKEFLFSLFSDKTKNGKEAPQVFGYPKEKNFETNQYKGMERGIWVFLFHRRLKKLEKTHKSPKRQSNLWRKKKQEVWRVLISLFFFHKRKERFSLHSFSCPILPRGETKNRKQSYHWAMKKQRREGRMSKRKQGGREFFPLSLFCFWLSCLFFSLVLCFKNSFFEQKVLKKPFLEKRSFALSYSKKREREILGEREKSLFSSSLFLFSKKRRVWNIIQNHVYEGGKEGEKKGICFSLFSFFYFFSLPGWSCQ
jgi:hypothetical protein